MRVESSVRAGTTASKSGCDSATGEAYLELATEAAPLAARRDCSAMQLHKASHQRQADPQSAARALALVIHLRKHLENAIELIGGHTDAAVPYEHDDLAVLTFGREPDSSSRLRVPDRRC